MLEIDPRYTQFVQQVVRQCAVFTLQDEEDFFAECPSESYDDTLGNPVPIYCFWHNADDALACQQDEWQDYALLEITLDEWINEVLIPMDTDEQLVGVAFDAELFGTEIEPIELLMDILTEIEQQNCADEFESFTQWQHICQQWQNALEQVRVIH